MEQTGVDTVKMMLAGGMSPRGSRNGPVCCCCNARMSPSVLSIFSSLVVLLYSFIAKKHSKEMPLNRICENHKNAARILLSIDCGMQSPPSGSIKRLR